MPEEPQELIDMVANNQYMYTSERNPVNNGAAQKRGVLEVHTLDAILAQNKLMSQQINMISQHLRGTQSSNVYYPETAYETDAKEPTIEDLKKIKAHEETDNVILHAPLLEEEHEECTSFDEYEESKEEQIAQFLAILRKLQANSSHTEVLEEEVEPVVLAKECNALVQKKLPQKLLDPGSFLIPCTIGTITFEKALCDLGSSINLMP
ncbi:uncharacterized protein LOC107493620 [Arachis duranensis]|uniref:Uncharacterized protein LOC107493620 n=1 Tax=Arachis duranensis TaxID=130453 RepID=A0A6P4DL98_ARADU|nr:uncharacterized protein LOC107493620 [Arachis duranensis]